MLRWALVLGLVAACGEPTRELSWRLELAIPERPGTRFDIYVVEGACSVRPTAAPQTWRRGDPPLSVELGEGLHAIRVTAIDPECHIYASGCAELTATQLDPVVVRLGASPEIARCPVADCDEGFCAPTMDAGVDASVVRDGAVEDAPTDAPDPDGCEPTRWYLDGDEDGFGDDERSVLACEAPPFHIAEPGDCDDNDPQAHLGMEESCSATDQDCDGSIDEGGVCAPCDPFELFGVRYLGCPAEVSWAQARSTCLADGRDLVTIETEAEDRALRDFVLMRFGVQQFWIGLQDVDGDGVFRWARSGEEPDYLPWTEADPDDAPPVCVRSTGSSVPPGWRDRACADGFMFVCDDE